MIKKLKIFVAIILVLPFLLSLDPTIYDSNYVAKYKSPEGILFLSYSKEWNKAKLQELYHELLQNKHGKEIDLLQEVRVRAGSLPHSPYTSGRFNVLTNTIDLYHGDTFTEPSSFRQTLSHEYGHFFTYYYMPFFHFPFSKWAKLRGLANEPVHWDTFWNYTRAYHDWYPEEIIADDYVLLYGSTKKVKLKDVYDNEAFYESTQHSNQHLPNVLENKKLQQYLESQTGFKIDQNRFLQTPKLRDIQRNDLVFSVTKRKNICYRLNLTFYNRVNGTYHEHDYHEIVKIKDNANGILRYSLNSLLTSHPSFHGYMEANIDVLDLNTSLGLQTKPIYFKIHQHVLNGLYPSKP